MTYLKRCRVHDWCICQGAGFMSDIFPGLGFQTWCIFSGCKDDGQMLGTITLINKTKTKSIWTNVNDVNISKCIVTLLTWKLHYSSIISHWLQIYHIRSIYSNIGFKIFEEFYLFKRNHQVLKLCEFSTFRSYKKIYLTIKLISQFITNC